MAIQSLQTFILNNQETTTVGNAYERLEEYFREDVWLDPRIGSHSSRNRCYYEAGGDNEWGRKFTAIADPEDEKMLPIFGLTVGGVCVFVGFVVAITTIASGNFHAEMLIIGGSFAGFGLLPLTPGAYFLIKKHREVREIKREDLDTEKVQDLIAQILIVLNGRQHVHPNLIARIRGEQQN